MLVLTVIFTWTVNGKDHTALDSAELCQPTDLWLDTPVPGTKRVV
jgi:hypothetical protein